MYRVLHNASALSVASWPVINAGAYVRYQRGDRQTEKNARSRRCASGAPPPATCRGLTGHFVRNFTHMPCKLIHTDRAGPEALCWIRSGAPGKKINPFGPGARCRCMMAKSTGRAKQQQLLHLGGRMCLTHSPLPAKSEKRCRFDLDLRKYQQPSSDRTLFAHCATHSLRPTPTDARAHPSPDRLSNAVQPWNLTSPRSSA